MPPATRGPAAPQSPPTPNPDDAAAQAAEDAAADEVGGDAVVSLNTHLVATFDPSVDGVDPITTDGTSVPADKVKAVRDAAKASDVRITVKGV